MKRLAAVIFAAIVASGSACASDAPLLEPRPSDEREREAEYENSGRTLTGAYSLASPAPPVAAAQLSFTDDGEFERTRQIGDLASVDGGTYLIDSRDRLVLYVERNGSSRLTSAVPHVFGFASDSPDAFRITRPDGQVESYARASVVENAPSGASALRSR